LTYALTHVIYALNNFDERSLPPTLFPPTVPAFLREQLRGAMKADDPDLAGELLDCLKCLGEGGSPLVVEAEQFLVARQSAADGGWVCKGEADLYSRYHASLVAVAALLDHSYRAHGPAFAGAVHVLPHWFTPPAEASSGEMEAKPARKRPSKQARRLQKLQKQLLALQQPLQQPQIPPPTEPPTQHAIHEGADRAAADSTPAGSAGAASAAPPATALGLLATVLRGSSDLVDADDTKRQRLPVPLPPDEDGAADLAEEGPAATEARCVPCGASEDGRPNAPQQLYEAAEHSATSALVECGWCVPTCGCAHPQLCDVDHTHAEARRKVLEACKASQSIELQWPLPPKHREVVALLPVMRRLEVREKVQADKLRQSRWALQMEARADAQRRFIDSVAHGSGGGPSLGDGCTDGCACRVTPNASTRTLARHSPAVSLAGSGRTPGLPTAIGGRRTAASGVLTNGISAGAAAQSNAVRRPTQWASSTPSRPAATTAVRP